MNFKLEKWFVKLRKRKPFFESKEDFLVKPKIFVAWLLVSVASNTKKYKEKNSKNIFMPPKEPMTQWT